MQLESFIEFFKKNNLFDKNNQSSFTVIEPGKIEYIFKTLPIHQSTPGFIHGGAIAGFMDALLGLSALTKAVVQDQLTSTIELKTNFFRPIKVGDELIGKSEIVFEGKSIITATGDIFDGKSKIKLATSIGTFNKYPLEKKAFIYEQGQ